jgi:hypothetical protein
LAATALLVALAPAVLGAPADAKSRAPLPGKTYSWTFAADTLGQAPAFTRTAGGNWAVVEDSTRAGARLLRQVEADDGLGSHALQFLKPKVADQESSVRYRIRSGEIDPSVGIALHLDAKGKNGYLIRVSGRDGEVIAHYILNGRRRDLKVAPLEPPAPGSWHTLGVRRMGERIEVLCDGVVKMKFRDERFREGNVGLWTEDDTVADFADLTVRTL